MREFVELRVTMVLIAWECAEHQLRNARDCADMRPAKCVEMRGPAACVEMRVASMPPNHGSSARDAGGKRAEIASRINTALGRHVFVICYFHDVWKHNNNMQIYTF